MKTLKYLYKTALVLVFVVFSACDFGDTNIDPSNPTEAPVTALLPTAQARMAYHFGGDFARYNALFTQHFSGTGRQHLTYDNYVFDGSNVNTAWRQMYHGAFQDLTVISKLASEEGSESPHYSGVVKVLTANFLGMMSDMWGNIPYSEAGKNIENLKPKYDTRDEIYASIHRLLEEARADLSSDNSLLSPGADDLIYGGDLEKWIKASHALDARYYLHRGVMDKARTSVDNAFEGNEDDMVFVFGTSATEAGPLFQWLRDRTDTNMGKFFIDLMKGKNDPRLPVFATQDAKKEYSGAAPGVGGGTESQANLYYAAANAPVPFISYTELKFIEAEAYLGVDQARANAALDEAITASLDKVVGEVDAAYVSTEGSASGDATLEKIQVQKYIALYYQAETWNELRRTGFPKEIKPPAKSNLSSGMMPQRWPYPDSERDFNSEHYQANKAADPEMEQPLAW